MPASSRSPAPRSPAAPTLTVGSKRFTESYILGEILKQTAQAAGEATATHSQGLGNTAIVLNALTTGSIDIYPEYTGTIAKEILKLDSVPSLSELNAKLAPMGLAVAVPLGFNNTYALAMRGDDARAKNIARLSDLAHPDVRPASHRTGAPTAGRAEAHVRIALRDIAGLDHRLLMKPSRNARSMRSTSIRPMPSSTSTA